MRRTGIILAGHGSHISSATAGLVWEQVDRLRSLKAADEITAAFWKEPPSFHRVLDTVRAEEIAIVPLFTAQGYFTQTVIPAEMALEGAVTYRDGRTLYYTRTLNQYPYFSQVIRRRIDDTLQAHALSQNQTSVAIIGHSTRRNPESRLATERQVESLQQEGIAAYAVFLDDSPEISEIYGMIETDSLVAVPYFLAYGSHTTIDVPRELGLDAGAWQGFVEGKQVFYTAPVGTDDDLTPLILKAIEDAGLPLRNQRGRESSAWGGFPSAGRDLLIQAVEQGRLCQFGELAVSPESIYIAGDEGEKQIMTSPGQLRNLIRENPFRPLPTALGLPHGWIVYPENITEIHAIIETIYPGVVADWAQQSQGNLEITTLESHIARQTGMYKKLADLGSIAQAELKEQLCGRCVLHPVWSDGVTDRKNLPCPEACNVWLSAALEVME